MTSASRPLAYLVGSPECHETPELAYQAPLDQTLHELREIGYDGVEIQVRDPADPRCSDLGERCRDAGLRVAALGTGPVSGQDHLTLTSLDEQTRKAALDRLRRIMDLAGEVQAPVTLGKSRGSLDLGHEDEQGAWFVSAVHDLARRAADGGQRLLLEPQSTGRLLRSAAETVQMFGDPTTWPEGLGVVLDTWHAEQTGDEWGSAWEACGPRMSYVQMAGPARGPIVTGDQLTALLAVADDHAYAGWLCAEHLQGGDSRGAARATLAALRAEQDSGEVTP